MNKQELIKYCESLKGDLNKFINGVDVDKNIAKIEQLDEPQAGHSEEAPRYVKNILARLRELPLHDREVWLKAIMGEFERDFSRAKWREGYEQGKFEASLEINKMCPVVTQMVADWYEENKSDFETSLFQCIYEIFKKRNDEELDEFEEWIIDDKNKPFQTLINMHQFGYTVEKETRYLVRLKNKRRDYLVNTDDNDFCFYNNIYTQNREHTRKEIEDAGFGWVFSCEGIEIEEVEG